MLVTGQPPVRRRGQNGRGRNNRAARIAVPVTAAVAQGELTIREAWEFSQTIDNFIRTIDTSEFARQLERLEAAAERLTERAREAADAGEP